MSDFMDRVIADLIEGAQRSEGFIRGSRAGVELQRENRGREEKLANHAGLGALAGGLALPGLGAPIGAALGADEGQRGHAAIGSVLGGAGGALAGGALGGGLGTLSGNPEIAKLLAMSGAGVGGVGGMMYGASRGGEAPSIMDRIRDKLSALEQRYVDGMEEATTRFGVKEAFLPMLGALAGGSLLRGGLGMAAKRFGGNAIGRGAQGALNWAGKGGMRGGALDMAGSMAGGAIGNQLQGPPGP